MTRYTTRSAEKGAMTFTAPAARDDYAGYVWLEAERGYAAGERRQICHGGGFQGSTITATPQSLKADAQRWMRDRRKMRRAEGLD